MIHASPVRLRRLMAGVVVDDLKAAGRWYERVLGRAPDAAPMSGLLEWRFNDEAWLQVVDVAKVRDVQKRQDWGAAGSSSVSFVVENIDEQLALFVDNNIPIVSKFTTNSALKTATVCDPSGNFVTFVQQSM